MQTLKTLNDYYKKEPLFNALGGQWTRRRMVMKKNITNQELKNYSLENGANNNCFVASSVCSCNI